MHLHNICQKEESELVKCVFKDQNKSPTKGDSSKGVKGDMELVRQNYDEDFI